MATNQHIGIEQPEQSGEQAKPRIVSFRCPVDVVKALRKQAIDNDSSVEAEVVAALRKHLGLVKAA